MDEDRVRKVAEWYDKLASSYDELYGEEQALKHKIILDCIGAERRSILLDVGCGTGRFMEKADPLFSLGIGVDVSKQMLTLAKRRRSSKTDFVLATSSRLPIRDNTVDCTISISTSEADAGAQGFIREVERIGNENSLLAMTLFEQPSYGERVAMGGVQFSLKINDRETLYVFGLSGIVPKR